MQRDCGVKGRSTREANETSDAEAGEMYNEEETARVHEESSWVAPPRVVAQSGGGGAGGAGGGGTAPLELELFVGAGDLLTADTLVRADHRDATRNSFIYSFGLSIATHDAAVSDVLYATGRHANFLVTWHDATRVPMSQ